ARRRPAAAGFSAPAASWIFEGPQPITGEIANFAGFQLGAGTLSSATGRIAAIASAPGYIFVGAASGGLWMSTNDGASFTSIGDNLPTTSIGAIALDRVNISGNSPAGAPTIYVGTGEGNGSFDSYYGAGLFKSTNLGVSRTALPASNSPFVEASFTRLAIDSSKNPPVLLAAVTVGLSAGRSDPAVIESQGFSNGIWRSSDGGLSWTQKGNQTFASNGIPSFNGCQFLNIPGIPCPGDDVAIDPLNPNLAYAAIDTE